jgi:hypothetical protein
MWLFQFKETKNYENHASKTKESLTYKHFDSGLKLDFLLVIEKKKPNHVEYWLQNFILYIKRNTSLKYTWTWKLELSFLK